MRDMTLEKFAAKLKRQNRFMWCALAISFVYMVVIGEWDRISDIPILDSRTITQLAENMQTMVFFGWQAYLVWRIVHNRNIIASGARLKDEMIGARDERKAAINGATGSRFALIFMIALSIALVTASFFSMPIFYTLYGVIVGALAIWGGLKLYYTRKL